MKRTIITLCMMLACVLSINASNGTSTLCAPRDTVSYTEYKKDMPAGDALLDSIVKQHEGKVVLVTFWGTWNETCTVAMQYFDEHKQSYADKGVVYVYLTDELSPIKEWEEKKASIAGEHYRLSSEQSYVLCNKYEFFGWPSYLIFDSKGDCVYKATSYDEGELFNALNVTLQH